MRGKNITFLVLPALVYGLFLFFAPLTIARACTLPEGEWRDTSGCIADACGTTDGTKTQTLFVEVCDEECPTRSFKASRTVYEEDFIEYGSTWGPWSSCSNSNKCPNDDENAGVCEDTGSDCTGSKEKMRYKVIVNAHACPVGYTYKEQSGPNDCYKEETFGPIDVVYGLKSSDPNKCHRPTGSSLGIPSWAMNDFNTDPNLPEHIRDSKPVNCRFEESSHTREVSCTADLILCEEDCPTECGYPGGTVADGFGGLKRCPATESCSTYRWCFPDRESPTGYLAQAISISIPNPEIGKPWDSSTMINRYCYERCSVTNTVYGDWSEWIVENGNESQLFRIRTATNFDSIETDYVCSVDTPKEVTDRPLCEYPGVTYADDPLCLPIDDGEDVLGEDDEVKDTGVVLGATGPGDNLDIYLVELLLVAISISSYVFLSNKYLKNSR